MKKKLLIYTIIAALLLCVLCACGAHNGNAPLPSAPADISATFVPSSAAPTAAPSAPAGPLDAGEGIYTIAWFSDTQHYSAKFPAAFYAMTDFLAAQKEAMNLKYVAFTGDFVNAYGDEAQWQTAVKAMEPLRGIPYGVTSGNHDVDGSRLQYDKYGKYFGEAQMKDVSCYGGSYKNNRGHYDLIDAGGTKYIFAYMGSTPDSAGIKWLDEVFSAHADRVGILCVHEYFDTDMSLLSYGKELREKVVAKNPNVYFVFSGHRYTIGRSTLTFDDDGDGTAERTVTEMICNYQAAGAEGGDGYMRFLQIDEAAGKIYVKNYSPLKDDFDYFDTAEHLAEQYPSTADQESFTLDIPWDIAK